MSSLAEMLTAEDAAEDAGILHADDRTTCFAHQAWATDCVGSRLHANAVTGHNWCRDHGGPVTHCRCWEPNVTGRPPGEVR